MSINSVLIGLGNIGMIYDDHNNSNLIQSHAKAVHLHPGFITKDFPFRYSRNSKYINGLYSIGRIE